MVRRDGADETISRRDRRGPAGLTAAYYLIRRNVNVTVLEQDHQVGGLARP